MAYSIISSSFDSCGLESLLSVLLKLKSRDESARGLEKLWVGDIIERFDVSIDSMLLKRHRLILLTRSA